MSRFFNQLPDIIGDNSSRIKLCAIRSDMWKIVRNLGYENSVELAEQLRLGSGRWDIFAHQRTFDLLCGMIQQAEDGNSAMSGWPSRHYWVVENRQAPCVVGGININLPPNKNRAIAISYFTAERVRKQGFATAAISMLSRTIFATDFAETICAEVLPDNIASAATLQSAGFSEFPEGLASTVEGITTSTKIARRFARSERPIADWPLIPTAQLNHW